MGTTELAIPTHKPAVARPAHSMLTFCEAHCIRLPAIQKTQPTCSDTLRDRMSARNDDIKDPTNDPAGIDAVMAPCTCDTGFPKYFLYACVPMTPDMDEMSKPKSAPPAWAERAPAR